MWWRSRYSAPAPREEERHGLLLSGARFIAASPIVRPALLATATLDFYMVVNYGVRPLGSLAGGALATAIGTRETLLIAAAGGTLAVLWLVRSPLLGMRELPDAAEAEPVGEAAA
jgi:hypothetical protein